MRKSFARGAAISAERMAGWIDRFRFYRAPPNQAAINTWLNRFEDPDKDVAARVLDCTEVISEEDIHLHYRNTLNALKGWHSNSQKRKGNWYFVGFGGHGESGASMLRLFREANGLTQGKYNYLFCGVTDLPGLELTADDTVVFIDDISGSGRQVCSTWPTIEELMASEARCYLVLTAVTDAALKKIGRETTLDVKASIILRNPDNLFHPMCHAFNDEEKAAILKYCKVADVKNPKGSSDCGLLFVLSHKTPNNTIPILHVNKTAWKGLFVRNLTMVAG